MIPSHMIYPIAMSEHQLDDLKQFIASSVSQSEECRRNEMHQGFEAVREGFQAVRKEMADRFLAIGDAIDEIHKQQDKQSKVNATVDKRLTKLERRIA